jgi:hypothetical protein
MPSRKTGTRKAPPVPPELASWMAERLRLIESEMIDISQYESDSEAAWSLFVLGKLSNIEALSFEMTRLMTKYTVDEKLARPATIAKLTGVHQSSVMSRASSEVARRAWQQIWSQGQI